MQPETDVWQIDKHNKNTKISNAVKFTTLIAWLLYRNPWAIFKRDSLKVPDSVNVIIFQKFGFKKPAIRSKFI